MKKVFLILLLTIIGLKSYAQAGDLEVGAIGGYATKYKTIMYGINGSYNISNILQVSLTGLINPSFTYKDELDYKWDYSTYTANLDARLFLLNTGVIAMGPSLGMQYMHVTKERLLKDTEDRMGFNIGWHIKGNLTESLRINGGWRYSTVKDNESYHLIYVGIGYAFNLF